MVKRFEVYMCAINGKERPGLVISPDELNEALPYVLIAPITTSGYLLPCRIGIGLKGKKAWIAMDLIQPVNQTQLVSKIGLLPEQTHTQSLTVLQKFFAS